MFYFRVGQRTYLHGINAKLLEDIVGYVGGLFKQGLEQVHRFDALLSCPLCNVHGLLDRFLRFDCILVEVHCLYL